MTTELSRVKLNQAIIAAIPEGFGLTPSTADSPECDTLLKLRALMKKRQWAVDAHAEPEKVLQEKNGLNKVDRMTNEDVLNQALSIMEERKSNEWAIVEAQINRLERNINDMRNKCPGCPQR